MYDYKDNKLQTPYFGVMLVKHWIIHIGVLSLFSRYRKKNHLLALRTFVPESKKNHHMGLLESFKKDLKSTRDSSLLCRTTTSTY